MVTTNIATPTLQVGATGSAVRNLQELLLRRVGVGGLTVDGDFGQITELAVRVFQMRNFLADDGIVGPQTWQVLLNGGVGHLPLLRRGDRGALVERLQRVLAWGTDPANTLDEIASLTPGYYFGQIDGDFGPMTETAVKAFQQTPPLNRQPLTPVDGIVGPQTWTVLTELVARVTHIGL